MLYAQHTDTQTQTTKRSTLQSIKAWKILKELNKVERRFLLFWCYKGFYFYIPKCSWCGDHAVFFRLTLRLRLRRSPAEMSLPLEATLLQLRICDWTSCMIFVYSVSVVHNYYILLIKSTRHQNVFFNKLYGGCAFQITSRAVLKFSRYNRGLRYSLQAELPLLKRC